MERRDTRDQLQRCVGKSTTTTPFRLPQYPPVPLSQARSCGLSLAPAITREYLAAATATTSVLETRGKRCGRWAVRCPYVTPVELLCHSVFYSQFDLVFICPCAFVCRRPPMMLFTKLVQVSRLRTIIHSTFPNHTRPFLTPFFYTHTPSPTIILHTRLPFLYAHLPSPPSLSVDAFPSLPPVIHTLLPSYPSVNP